MSASRSAAAAAGASRYVRARRSARMGKNRATPGKSIQRIAEERASRRYPNMEVLNWYWVGQDGKLKYYEVILVDGHHPSIRSDKNLAWLANPDPPWPCRAGKDLCGTEGTWYEDPGQGYREDPPEHPLPCQPGQIILSFFPAKGIFMKITDACVYPYPAGDSSIRRFALEARSCGYDSIVAADTPAAEVCGITVIPGIFLAGIPAKDVQSRVKKSRGTGAVVAVQMGDNGFNRSVAGTNGVHILRGIHAADKRAFDHVAAKIAADNTTAIDIDLSPLIFGRGHLRQKAIHRYLDLMVLHRRFEIPAHHLFVGTIGARPAGGA